MEKLLDERKTGVVKFLEVHRKDVCNFIRTCMILEYVIDNSGNT